MHPLRQPHMPHSTVSLGRLLLPLLIAGLIASATSAQDAGGDPAEPTGQASFAEAVEVRIVNLDVYVTDRGGEPITGLGPSDFQLLVNGDEVEIANFYAQVDGRPSASIDQALESIPQAAPRRGADLVPAPGEVPSDRQVHLALVVDHRRLRATNRKRALKTMSRFLQENLRPSDLVTVISIKDGLIFHSDFLYDRDAVDQILLEVLDISARASAQEAERRRLFGELARGQSGGFAARAAIADADADQLMARIRAYATEEYQNTQTSIGQLERVVAALAGIPGRKALVYVSDGIPDRPGEGLFVEWRNRFGGGNPDAGLGLRRFDFNTDYRREVGNFDILRDMKELSDRANAAGVTFYALDAESDHAGEVRSAATEQGATSETLEVVNANLRAPLELTATQTGGRRFQASGTLLEQLGDLARDFGTYYSLGFPPPPEAGDGTLNLEVRIRGQRNLRVRHRESVRLSGADERAAQATLASLLFLRADNPLGIELAPGDPTPRDDGRVVLPVRIDIPIARLAMLPQGETFSVDLYLYVATLDAAGDPGQVQRVPFHLEIPSQFFEQALEDAANYPLPVVLEPGDQQVAIGVRDDNSGVIATERLDVRDVAPPLRD
ncbi:MAG: VWA domain-containing protein [Acidobacteriota bacterium]